MNANLRTVRSGRLCTAALALCCLLSLVEVARAEPFADAVVVRKSQRRLYLLRDGAPFAWFSVALGANPQGHKQQQGDERTPEGRYLLDRKNRASGYYKSIHISYPNGSDRARARRHRVDPGGLIMIHGQKNGQGWLAYVTQRSNWTDGCIALRNEDMDEVWSAVREGTPIEILP